MELAENRYMNIVVTTLEQRSRRIRPICKAPLSVRTQPPELAVNRAVLQNDGQSHFTLCGIHYGVRGRKSRIDFHRKCQIPAVTHRMTPSSRAALSNG